jgi:hypothetical protein
MVSAVYFLLLLCSNGNTHQATVVNRKPEARYMLKGNVSCERGRILFTKARVSKVLLVRQERKLHFVGNDDDDDDP